MNAFDSTPDELVNDAVMHWTAGIALLVVEGTSDRTVLTRLLDGDAVHVAVASDKSTARTVLRLLADEDDLKIGPARVLIDRDDDQGPSEDGRLIRTIGRDLDAEIAAAPNVLLEVLWQVLRCRNRLQAQGYLDQVVRAAHGMRALRVMNAQRGLGWRLKSVQMGHMLKVDASRADAVLALVQVGSDFEDWISLREEVSVLISQPKAIERCQGHDLHGLVAALDNRLSRESVQNQCAGMVHSASIKPPTLELLRNWLEFEGLSGRPRAEAA